jgi:hypothetical protein
MYAPALFLMAIVTLAATAGIAGIAGAARAATSIVTQRALETGVRHAVALYQRGTAAAIASDPAYTSGTGSVALLADSTQLTPATYTETSAPFTLSETVTPTTIAPPNCASDGGGGDVASDLQCSTFVQESRASLRIDVTILAPDGKTVLGSRSVIGTLRLFATPPFSELTGMKDVTQPNPTDANVDDDATAPREDDSAGRNGNVVAPDASIGSAASGPGDTTIHVQYQCLGANCDQPRPPAPDALANRHWTNGNTTVPSTP